MWTSFADRLYGAEPEPGSISDVTDHIKQWLDREPVARSATIQIREGPKDVFGSMIILFEVPTNVITRTKGDLDFVPYGFPAGTEIWEAEYGFIQWKGFREISQALFFQILP